MQELEDAHRVEIKVYMQKVKHLEYEHTNNCERVQHEAAFLMKEERNHHVDDEKDMRKNKSVLKEDYERDEM
jgi:CMP-N-acetylneuraminic acid synthetase